MNNNTTCPHCGCEVIKGEGKAPLSEHVAIYHSCTQCDWHAVERTPEHEAELKGEKK